MPVVLGSAGVVTFGSRQSASFEAAGDPPRGKSPGARRRVSCASASHGSLSTAPLRACVGAARRGRARAGARRRGSGTCRNPWRVPPLARRGNIPSVRVRRGTKRSRDPPHRPPHARARTRRAGSSSAVVSRTYAAAATKRFDAFARPPSSPRPRRRLDGTRSRRGRARARGRGPPFAAPLLGERPPLARRSARASSAREPLSDRQPHGLPSVRAGGRWVVRWAQSASAGCGSERGVLSRKQPSGNPLGEQPLLARIQSVRVPAMLGAQSGSAGRGGARSPSRRRKSINPCNGFMLRARRRESLRTPRLVYEGAEGITNEPSFVTS